MMLPWRQLFCKPHWGNFSLYATTDIEGGTLQAKHMDLKLEKEHTKF